MSKPRVRIVRPTFDPTVVNNVVNTISSIDGNVVAPVVDLSLNPIKLINEKADKQLGKTRNWCFTINNPVATKEQWLEKLKDNGIRYVVMGDEVGDSGTPHIQGYIDFVSQRAFSGVAKLFENVAHIEQRKGTWKQASDYCKKGGAFIEFGKPPRQGARGDIEDVKDAVLSGMSMGEMIDEGYISNHQQLRFAEGLKKYKDTPRKLDKPPKVLWFYGPTGTFKTRTAKELYPDAWMSGRNLKWWDGYDGHKEIIIDDFRKDFCTFHELLRILDRYPFRVEIKGGSMELQAEVIVITCPYHPEELYEGRTDEDISQLTRRITEIRRFNNNNIIINNNSGTEQKSAGNTSAADFFAINNSDAIINSGSINVVGDTLLKAMGKDVVKVVDDIVPRIPTPKLFGRDEPVYNCY